VSKGKVMAVILVVTAITYFVGNMIAQIAEGR
jgi:hypothetical protein